MSDIPEEEFKRYDQYLQCYDEARSSATPPDGALLQVFSELTREIVDRASRSGGGDEDGATVLDSMMELLYDTFKAGYIFSVIDEEETGPSDTLTFLLDSDSVSTVIKGLVDGRVNIHVAVVRP